MAKSKRYESVYGGKYATECVQGAKEKIEDKIELAREISSIRNLVAIRVNLALGRANRYAGT